MKCRSSCLARMYLSFIYVKLDLAFVRTRFRACFNVVSACVHKAICCAVQRGMPLTGTVSQTLEHLAIDWRGAPKSETQSQVTVYARVQGFGKP